MNTYERIKGLCERHGIGVTVLEAELGFSRGSIGKMKNGGTTSTRRLRKIAEYFGVSLDYLESGGTEAPQDASTISLDVLLKPGVRELLIEAEKADPDDLRAVTETLRRLNAYAQALARMGGKDA